jgi:hypothetical protein
MVGGELSPRVAAVALEVVELSNAEHVVLVIMVRAMRVAKRRFVIAIDLLLPKVVSSRFCEAARLWPIDLHTSFATASVQTIVTVYRSVLCVEYASIQYRICLSVNDWATVYEIGIRSSALISCSRVKGVQSCFKDPCAMCSQHSVYTFHTLRTPSGEQ